MDQITKASAVSFLREVNILTAALVGERGPISTPLIFAVEDDLSKLYVATHRDTFKAQALLKDPRISCSIWQFDKMLIQLDGTAKEIVDPVSMADKVDKLVESLSHLEGFWPPVIQVGGEGYIVFEITPTWIRALNLSSKNILSGDNPFTEVEL
jgi:nitroimidazol reductase NimA-like FMN-containing flavoprotein (pyridoxamine 5'-phosphate oxidase superfamily)